MGGFSDVYSVTLLCLNLNSDCETYYNSVVSCVPIMEFSVFLLLGKELHSLLVNISQDQEYMDRSCIFRIHPSTNCVVRSVIIIKVWELIMRSHELIAEGFRIYESG